MKTSYLYIMHEKGTDNFKIGVSTDPLKRAISLPNNIDFKKSTCSIGTVDQIKNAEKGVHKTFYHKNIEHIKKFDGHTEWFCGSILENVKKYLEEYFGLSEWVVFADGETLKKEEIKFIEINKPETKTRYSYVIVFKNESEDDQDIGRIVIGDKVKEDIFCYEPFRELWKWFYLKDSKIYNTYYTLGNEMIMRTIIRDEVKRVYGKIEDTTEK